MADRTLSDRLQPALLDRLTDDAPQDRKEGRDARVIDLNRLRDVVRRDLSWLLNANNLDTVIDEVRYPHATRSVINYGVREVAGDYSTKRRGEAIRTSILRAIQLFEPRIAADTLQINLRRAGSQQATLVFDIVADLWAQPMPVELYLRSEIDLTTGKISLDYRK
ncbi:type VI secretion system baseplate subunit TssE [Rhodobacteraceae bacterium CCMM004]|nr:type VI secretion system baseplate subunit TssE [Rhodobacteraceae bacterium CCMM004]